MRVVFLTEYYPGGLDRDAPGGVEQRVFDFSQTLAPRHEVTVVASRQPGQPSEQIVGRVRLVRPGPAQPYWQGGSGVWARLRFVRAAVRVLRRRPADVYVGENFLCHAVLWALPQLRARSVLDYHDVWIGRWVRTVGLATGVIGEVMERLVLRASWPLIVCNSALTQRQLRAAGVRSETVVIPPGIRVADCEAIAPEPFETPTVVSVGRLIAYKRVADLLRAFVRVRSAVPDARLVIIGSGPEADRLRALAAHLGIADAVAWRGFVPRHRDVLAALKGATVFSLPSAVEGFGIVTLEAMALGTPYVNSRIPATEEVTANGHGGVLYPLGDVEALAAGLVRFLRSPDERARASAAGRARARAYDWPDLARQFETRLTALADSSA